MSIISMKRYMGDAPDDTTFRRTISNLMQAMVLHAVRGDHSDYEKFRADSDEIDAAAPADAGAEDLLKLAHAAIEKLAEYNRRTSHLIHLQGAELHKMIGMLTDTVIEVGSCGDQSSKRLKAIERQLGETVALQDVKSLRESLRECLSNLREEADRQRSEAEAASARMREHLGSARDRVQHLTEGQGERCKVTGLPLQEEAEIAMANALERPHGQGYVAAFLVDRIQVVNLRFGYAVGDRLVAEVARSVRRELTERDRLFRWRGPGLVALIDRDERVDVIRRQMARASVISKAQMFQIGQREVMVPVSASWRLFPLTAPLKSVLSRVQHFICEGPAAATPGNTPW